MKDGDKKSPYPDPLEISPINPLDYRFDEKANKWVHEPGWWKRLTMAKKKRKGKKDERVV